MRSNFSQIVTLIRKIARQVITKTYNASEAQYSSKKNMPPPLLSHVGGSALKKLIEVSQKIDEGKKVAKINDKLIKIINEVD